MKKQWLAILAGAAMTVSGIAQTTSTTRTATQTATVPRRSAVTSSVTLPAGTGIDVRVNETLTSAEAQDGDRFTGTVATDVTLENGRVVIPRGAEVAGRVVSAKPSGRLNDSGELQLSISTVRSGSTILNVSSEPFVVKGEAHTKSNTTKIGGGAALGAIIGAVAGGGKGAAIGAGVGAAAGTGAAAATGKREAVVESEAVLKFLTATDTKVTIAAAMPSQTGVQAPQQTGDEEPVLRRREGSSAEAHPANAASTSASTKSNTVWTDERADYYTLSLRDKRVLSNCLHENAALLPAGILTKDATSTALTKGQALPVNLGRKVRSLPLACERELPALPNDMERVVYGGQVLLLDAQSKILDVWGVQ